MGRHGGSAGGRNSKSDFDSCGGGGNMTLGEAGGDGEAETAGGGDGGDSGHGCSSMTVAVELASDGQGEDGASLSVAVVTSK